MGRKREAINYSALHGMRQVVKHLAEQMAKLHPLVLTHDEMLHLCAPAEHHHILKEAAEVAIIGNFGAGQMVLEIPTVSFSRLDVSFVMVDVDGKRAPLMPRFPMWQNTSEGHEAREKVHKWIAWKAEVGREFGIVNHALSVLAAKCSTAKEVRFQFPSILALCMPIGNGYDECLKEFHDSVLDFEAPRHTPALTATERKLIREAAGYVSAVSLLPSEVIADKTQYEVVAGISHLPDFVYGEITINRIN